MAETTATAWVCDNCILWLANRDDSGMSEGDPRPLNLLTEDDDVAPGMMLDEHADDCSARCVGGMTEGCDRECEVQGFSSDPCVGCGTDLAGSRSAVTFFVRD